MRLLARLFGGAGRGALRAYASDTAFYAGIRLALLLLVMAWVLAIAMVCGPAGGGDPASAPGLCGGRELAC